MRRIPYVQLDVFTHRRLEGNPLALFTDARGIADAQLQALARETNLSETVFLFPRDAAVEAERGVRARIFTPREEFPFAGHPTLGAAFYLQSQRGGELIELDLNAGKIPVRFRHNAAGELFGEMQQNDPVFGEVLTTAQIAAATGLVESAFDASLPVQKVSTGLPFYIVPLRSVEELVGLSLDFARFTAALGREAKPYFVVRTPTGFRARMIFYQGEDPATGSAAGCCAAWAVACGAWEANREALIEQGGECGRPSRLHVVANRENMRIFDVRVGGQAVEIFCGEARID